jgi:hypothetical protein
MLDAEERAENKTWSTISIIKMHFASKKLLQQHHHHCLALASQQDTSFW